MKTKLSILIATFLMLLTYGNTNEFSPVKNLPPETSILELSDNSQAGWKEIARKVSEKRGLVELIPVQQTTKDWSELIRIQYFCRSEWKGAEIKSINHILDRIRETTLSLFPGSKVTWKIIERNKNSVIYEWILHRPYENTSPQHEIVRCFFTKHGYHSLSFTRKNAVMSSSERKNWIKQLRESSSIVPMQKINNISRGLSMADRLKDSLDLGAVFQDWKELHTYVMDNGYTLVCRIPSTQTGGVVSECLEVITMPNIYGLPLEDFYEIDRNRVQENSPAIIKFDVLKNSPTEIIYSYSHPRDDLHRSVVTKALMTNLGYYSINYIRGLPSALTKEEVHQWKDRLDLIKIKDVGSGK